MPLAGSIDLWEHSAMQSDGPIAVDDPAILALIARLAASLGCSEEEAIGFAVSRELASSGLAEGAASGSDTNWHAAKHS